MRRWIGGALAAVALSIPLIITSQAGAEPRGAGGKAGVRAGASVHQNMSNSGNHGNNGLHLGQRKNMAGPRPGFAPGQRPEGQTGRDDNGLHLGQRPDGMTGHDDNGLHLGQRKNQSEFSPDFASGPRPEMGRPYFGPGPRPGMGMPGFAPGQRPEGQTGHGDNGLHLGQRRDMAGPRPDFAPGPMPEGQSGHGDNGLHLGQYDKEQRQDIIDANKSQHGSNGKEE